MRHELKKAAQRFSPCTARPVVHTQVVVIDWPVPRKVVFHNHTIYDAT
jgi:hypothetical protein